MDLFPKLWFLWRNYQPLHVLVSSQNAVNLLLNCLSSKVLFGKAHSFCHFWLKILKEVFRENLTEDNNKNTSKPKWNFGPHKHKKNFTCAQNLKQERKKSIDKMNLSNVLLLLRLFFFFLVLEDPILENLAF